MHQVGEIISGKYRILDVIGQGGTSIVYKGVEINEGYLVAMKEAYKSNESSNQIFEQTLVTEGNTLKNLNNEHLVHIYDIVEDNQSYMLVMEFIDGISLDKVTANQGPQREDVVADWGIQICDVFTYIHSQRPPIIYRDMKPSNVMLLGDGNIMLIDFGTARTQKGGQIKQDTIIIGTEGFAAPEQYGGIGESDPRTDIYNLGATLYNLITGCSPAKPPQGIPKGILPLSYFGDSLKDSPFDYIISRATQNDPNNRYQTAEELKHDLELIKVGGLKKSLIKNTWQRQEFKLNKAEEKRQGTTIFSFKKAVASEAPASALPVDTPSIDPVSVDPALEAPVTDMPQPQEQFSSEQPSVYPQEYENNDVVSYAGEHMPEEETEEDNIWKRLFIICAVTAGAAFLLGVLFALMVHIAIGAVFIVLSIGAAVLSVVGLAKS